MRFFEFEKQEEKKRVMTNSLKPYRQVHCDLQIILYSRWKIRFSLPRFQSNQPRPGIVLKDQDGILVIKTLQS